MTEVQPITQTPMYSITGRCRKCHHLWIIPTNRILMMDQENILVEGEMDSLECNECDADVETGTPHYCPLELQRTVLIYHQDKRLLRED